MLWTGRGVFSFHMAEVFVHARFEIQLLVRQSLSDEVLAPILHGMEWDDRTRLFEQLPDADMERALGLRVETVALVGVLLC